MKPLPTEAVHCLHDDGNRSGGALGCTDCGGGRSDDEFHVELNQLSRQGRKSFRLRRGPPILDDRVAALDIAQLA